MPFYYERINDEVKSMMTRGLLRIDTLEEKMEVGMVVGCRYQPTENGPLKLICTKLVVNKCGNYNALPYKYRQSNPTIVSIRIFDVEIGGLIRSRRCFTLEELENQQKAKEKDVIDLIRTYEVIKLMSEEEATEFLKLMKHNEYSGRLVEENTSQNFSDVLDPKLKITLKCTPKSPYKAYVPQDMTQDSMKHFIWRIQSANHLYFTEDELDHEGTRHNKPL